MNAPLPFEETHKVIGAWVAGALIVVGVIGGSIDALVAFAVQGGLEAGAKDYLEFGQLFMATFVLSATLTAAIAAYFVPGLDGEYPSYWVPILILVIGASLTGLPVEPEGGTPPGFVVGALRTFAEYYGAAFASGLVVGVAGGGVVYELAKYSKRAENPN